MSFNRPVLNFVHKDRILDVPGIEAYTLFAFLLRAYPYLIILPPARDAVVLNATTFAMRQRVSSSGDPFFLFFHHDSP